MEWSSEELTQLTDEQFIHMYRKNKDNFMEQFITRLQQAPAAIREPLAIQPFFRLLQLQVLTQEEQCELFNRLVSELALFYELDEKTQTDAVITRATAAFLIGQLLPQCKSLVDFTPILLYLRSETDGRGQISETVGWSDAIGGAIDLAIAAVKHPNFQAANYVQLLQAIRRSIWSALPYTNNEEERFAKLIVYMLQKGLPDDALIEWVEQLFDKLDYYAQDYGHDLKWFEARTNTMAVMRATYFACKFSKQDQKIEAILSLFIQKYML